MFCASRECACLARCDGRESSDYAADCREYNRASLPWFEYYAADKKALSGGGHRDTDSAGRRTTDSADSADSASARKSPFSKIKSIVQIGKETGEVVLPENSSVNPMRVVGVRAGLDKNQVREGAL